MPKGRRGNATLRVAYPIHMLPWGPTPGSGLGRYVFEIARELRARAAELQVELRIYQDPGTPVGPFEPLSPKFFAGFRETLALPAGKKRGGRGASSRPPTTPPAWRSRLLDQARDWLRIRQLAREPVDLLHYPIHLGRPPAPRRLPVVITVHDLVPKLFPETIKKEIEYGWRQFLRAHARAAHFLCVSETTAEDLGRHLGIPRARITVTPHGVNTSFKPPKDRSAELEDLGRKYGVKARYLLHLSTIEPRKNQGAAVRALQDLPADITLVLAGGKGWKSEGLRPLIESLGLEQRVHFPGFVADEDLPALYGCAEAFVFPSHYEGFGMPILEAMACGTPVVCSRAGALPEVAADAALQVDADDWQGLAQAIRCLLESSSDRSEYCRRGLARVQLFTWERTARMTVEGYRAALDQSR